MAESTATLGGELGVSALVPMVQRLLHTPLGVPSKAFVFIILDLLSFGPQTLLRRQPACHFLSLSSN